MSCYRQIISSRFYVRQEFVLSLAELLNTGE